MPDAPIPLAAAFIFVLLLPKYRGKRRTLRAANQYSRTGLTADPVAP